MKSVAVIGGGITGLTAAYRLRQRGLAVTVFEGGSRVGGAIQSVREGDFLAECGPNSILETSPRISELIRDVGLDSRRQYSDPAAENRYLVRDGRPVAMPGSLGGFLGTPLFSTRAKLRLMAEPFIRRAPADVEESIAQFVTRRCGKEFLDHAIDALVAGVYAGEPSRLSVREAFPKLHALEVRYGSLILGQILGARARKRSQEVSKQNAKKISFDDGLQVLVDTLHEKLGESVRLNTPVSAIRAEGGGWQVAAGSGERFEAVLYTGTACGLARLAISHDRVPSLAPLAEINHPPVSSIVLGFRRADVAHPLNGFGMLIPRVEGTYILGTIFSSSLFPRRAPAGHVTLTSYVGGARRPELASKTPAELVELTLQDLRNLLGVTGRPVFQNHCFYPRAIPQYDLGFGRLRALMSQAEAAAPGLFLAGHYRDGISLGDSIVSAHLAADRIGNFLNQTTGATGTTRLQTAPLAA